MRGGPPPFGAKRANDWRNLHEIQPRPNNNVDEWHILDAFRPIAAKAAGDGGDGYTHCDHYYDSERLGMSSKRSPALLRRWQYVASKPLELNKPETMDGNATT